MAEIRALDIAEAQVLVFFPDDAGGFRWHRRILLHRVQEGRWVTLTPDHDLEVHDLNAIRSRLLDRGARFPPDAVDEVYAFDQIDKGTLNGFKRQARRRAHILGEMGDEVDQQAQVWVVSDPTDTFFGHAVEGGVLDDRESFVSLLDEGVVRLDERIRRVTRINKEWNGRISAARTLRTTEPSGFIVTRMVAGSSPSATP